MGAKRKDDPLRNGYCVAYKSSKKEHYDTPSSIWTSQASASVSDASLEKAMDSSRAAEQNVALEQLGFDGQEQWVVGCRSDAEKNEALGESDADKVEALGATDAEKIEALGESDADKIEALGENRSADKNEALDENKNEENKLGAGKNESEEAEETDEVVVEGIPGTPDLEDAKRAGGHCRLVYDFEKLNKLGEGVYGVVYKARDKTNGEIVALKQVKMMHADSEGFPVTSLREINLMITLQHPAIVGVKEVVIGNDMDKVYMVMEHIENNLKNLLDRRKKPLSHDKVKYLMSQLLSGVAYMHDKWILHRDLKPSNILITDKGEIKICDFGLARRYDDPIKPYTHTVVSLWYRAPELLVGTADNLYREGKYSTGIDVWSLGCIMAELILSQPLFPGKSEIDQLGKIKALISRGIPPAGKILSRFASKQANLLRERILWPDANAGRSTLSEKGLDLLCSLLTYDPDYRISAEDALKHPWFSEEVLPTMEDFVAAL